MIWPIRIAAATLLVSATASVCHAQAEAPLTKIEAEAPAPDEAEELWQHGLKEQGAGHHEAAIALFKRVLALPVAPDASPPGMLMPPSLVDWRGEARWGWAESKRAQGDWAEALALYQQNRNEYPRSEGCVAEGQAWQAMAVVEGNCLEHLGRVDEAVALYWPAALNLSGFYAPVAMRRLVTLYERAGQMPALQAAMAREEAAYRLYLRSMSTGRPEPLATDEQRQEHEERVARSAFGTFGAIVQARQLAREKKWAELLAIVRRDPSRRRRCEAATLLATPEAIPLLEAALREDADWELNPLPERQPSPYVAAALVTMGARTQDEITKISPRSWISADASDVDKMRDSVSYGALLQWPAPRRAPLTGAMLPPIFGAPPYAPPA